MKQFIVGILIGLTLSLPATAALKDVDGWDSVYAATFIGWSAGYTRAVEEQLDGANTKEAQKIESKCKILTIDVMKDCSRVATAVTHEEKEVPTEEIHSQIMHSFVK